MKRKINKNPHANPLRLPQLLLPAQAQDQGKKGRENTPLKTNQKSPIHEAHHFRRRRGHQR